MLTATFNKWDIKAIMVTEEELREILETLPTSRFSVYTTSVDDEYILAKQYILDDIEKSSLDLQFEDRPVFTKKNNEEYNQFRTEAAKEFMQRYGINLSTTSYVYIEDEDSRPLLVWLPITELFNGKYSSHTMTVKKHITPLCTIKNTKWKSFREQYLIGGGSND